ncbi:peptide/nickel transport system substrate-binding protein [Microterricola gilva]|uniref:Peptide/nickel transport system substrate-binding protein n=1 Tax=Microterricola gilva TaxID=393267 RepID=A0A4Q8ANN5_9MICO|nr:ABC transporter substrate-binding protein [Microterricola gilva]RZU66262.1 peptide/nickel transport system substrate-binding protein [Microterricola gilva]
MKKATIAAVLTASALVLTACSGGTDSNTESNGSDASSPDLNIGNFLDITSWDPSLADIGFDGPYLSAVYDPLVALDADGNPIPALATDWEVSDDFLTVTMNLRTDAKFSDGEVFNADAAVASLEYLKAGARSGEAYLNVDSVSAVDEDTIEFDLTQRDDTLLYFMGLGRSYMVSPAAISAGSLATTPVGSGPYTLDAATSVPGAEYHFAKVADHWDAATYTFPNLAIFPIMDATARHNAMLSGQINVNFAEPANIPQAEQNGWTVTSKVSGWVGLQFTDQTGDKFEPLGDERVRQALNYAFDGAAILDSIGSGAGEVSNQVFPSGSLGYDESLNGLYPYDVDKAKALLAEAGYADGFALTMPMSPIFQTWQAVAEQSLAAIGITVTWDDMQMPDYQINAPTYPVFISFLAMDSNPVATVARQVTSTQWYNPTPAYAAFPDVLAAVDTVHTATGEEQIQATADLNKLLTEKAWWSVWYQSANTYFGADDITVTPVTGMMFPTLRYIQHD